MHARLRGDSPKVRGLCLPFIRYLINDEKLTTDKMAVKLWQKMAVKKFAYVKKKQYLCTVIKKQT